MERTTLGPSQANLDHEFSVQNMILDDMSPKIVPKIRVEYVEPSLKTQLNH